MVKLTCHNAHYVCHTNMTLITSLTVVKYQLNTTPLVCGKSLNNNRDNLRLEIWIGFLGVKRWQLQEILGGGATTTMRQLNKTKRNKSKSNHRQYFYLMYNLHKL